MFNDAETAAQIRDYGVRVGFSPSNRTSLELKQLELARQQDIFIPGIARLMIARGLGRVCFAVDIGEFCYSMGGSPPQDQRLCGNEPNYIDVASMGHADLELLLS